MRKHLSRAVPAHTASTARPNVDSVYQRVTERILVALRNGVVPWRKPWKGREFLPCNAITKRPYSGINVLLLSMAPFTDHRWLTMRQANTLGGHIRGGETSSIAVFWKPWEVDEVEAGTGPTRRKAIPLLRLYHLFNVDQCDGLDLPTLNTTRPSQNERIQEAEALIRSMPRPPVIQECGGSAFYRPAEDLVKVPPIDDFSSPEAYYATLLHELAHATGHATRLNRLGVTGTIEFGSADYSREELIAELASAFCCAVLGLDNSLQTDAASYIQGWLARLESDPKAVISASTHGQRAADYIRGIDSGNGPSEQQEVSQ